MASNPFPIQRFTAALTALALALSLLVVAEPVRSALTGAGEDPASHQIGTGGPSCIGAVPSPPERNRVAPQGLAFLCDGVDAAQPAEPAAERNAALVGGTPPALSRWRLAHATSTSLP